MIIVITYVKQANAIHCEHFSLLYSLQMRSHISQHFLYHVYSIFVLNNFGICSV